MVMNRLCVYAVPDKTFLVISEYRNLTELWENDRTVSLHHIFYNNSIII